MRLKYFTTMDLTALLDKSVLTAAVESESFLIIVPINIIFKVLDLLGVLDWMDGLILAKFFQCIPLKFS